MSVAEFGLTKLVLSMAAFLLVLAGCALAHFGKKRGANLVHYLVALVSLSSVLNYLSLPPFVSWEYRPVNIHDSAHYYLGAKYFDEVGYFQLYNCLISADMEDSPAHAQGLGWRMVRNLKTNGLMPARTLLTSPDNQCRNRFNHARWLAFKQDAAFFRQLLSPAAWEKLTQDHGFNATPVWILTGSQIANLVPLTESSLIALTRIDLFAFASSLALIIWAFGWRTASLATLVMTTAPVADPFWTIGSLSRWDWLLLMVLSICLMKKGHPIVSGIFTAASAGLRIFPAVILFAMAIQLHKSMRSSCLSKPDLHKWFYGFAATAAVLLALVLGKWGITLLPEYVQNMWKHQSTVSRNDTGTKPLTEYSFSQLVGQNNAPAVSRFSPETRQQIRPIAQAAQAITLILFVIFFVHRSRALAPWQLLAAATLLIPFVFTNLSNYYYMFLLVTGLLAHNNIRLSLVLLTANLIMRLVQFNLGEGTTTFVTYSLIICISFVLTLLLLRPQPGEKP